MSSQSKPERRTDRDMDATNAIDSFHRVDSDSDDDALRRIREALSKPVKAGELSKPDHPKPSAVRRHIFGGDVDQEQQQSNVRKHIFGSRGKQ